MFGQLGAFGQDCGDGEYFDAIVKECLCKPGYVPAPLVGSCVPDPGATKQITVPQRAPAVSTASALPSWAPWALGGVAALGVLALLSKRRATPNGRRRATPNARVPKHKHKCVCFVKNRRR